MFTLRQFSTAALLWVFGFAGSAVWAAPNGLQDVGAGTTFTDTGLEVTSAEYTISGSFAVDQDKTSSSGKGAYLVSSSQTEQTITVSANGTTVASFELTAIVFEEYFSVISANFKVWIIGNVAGGGTIGSEANAVFGTSGSDSYTGARTSAFDGVQLTSFVIHFDPQTAHNGENLALRSFTTDFAQAPDATPPTVTGVTSSTANGAYNAGDIVSIQVSFDENVTVVGTPRLTLETGVTDREATYAGGSGGSTLTFNYTVQTGDTSADLDYISTAALTLNGGTIRDAASNNATLTLAAPGAAGSLGANKNLVIDTTSPSISIGAPSASITSAGSVTYTVTYTDTNFSASTLSTGNITLNSTGDASASIGVSGSGNTRTVTLSSITGNGTLGISIAAGTASDTAGNTAPAGGPSTTFTVDTTAPSISVGAPSVSLTQGGPVTYTVTYADTNFSASTLSTGNITLNSTGSASASIGVSGSGATRTVTLSSITGDGTLGITIAAGTASDTAGNTAASSGASSTFTVDNTAPVITSAGSAGGTYRTSGLGYTISATGGAVSYGASGLPAGLSVTPSTGEITGLPTDSGTFEATISATDTAGNTANSALTVTISPAEVTISGITAADKTYDGGTGATLGGVVSLNGVFGGDTVNLSGTAVGTFVSADVGTDIVVNVTGYTLAGVSSAHYTLTLPAATADITAAGLTVTGVTANDKAYDGTVSATLDLGSAALSGVVGDDDVTLTTGSATGAFADANVGTGKPVAVSGLALDGAASGNYSLTQPTTTADITAVQLTVTAENKTRPYGAANPTLTATITGFVNSETEAVLSGAPGLSTGADAASAVGDYTITAAIGTLSATNYTFAFVDGTLTVRLIEIADWEEENFTPLELLDPDVSGPTADPDFDGVTNLYEYAFGTDPNDISSGPDPLVYTGTFAGGGTLVETGKPITRTETTPTNNTRVLFIRRNPALTSDLEYEPQFSNGTAWVTSTATPQVLAESGLYQVVSVPYITAVNGKKTRTYRVVPTITETP